MVGSKENDKFNLGVKGLNNQLFSLVIYLNPKSSKHQIPSYNISPESHIKVMRIKEMITNKRSFWLVNKFSLSAP